MGEQDKQTQSQEIDPDKIMNLHFLYADFIAKGLWTWEKVPVVIYPYVEFVYKNTVGGKT